MKAALVMHAGAITPARGEHEKQLIKIVARGMKMLKEGYPALEVAESTILSAEDTALFNCGRGARLNLEGKVELDASIMNGRTLEAGAVAAMRNIRHPISVARKVMEETDHVLIVGRGAEKFARACGFERFDRATRERTREWKELRGKLLHGEKLPPNYASILNYWTKMKRWIGTDTVGVVAIDREGDIATGSSGGGPPLKMPGRVGDVPLIGCGTYACNAGGAVLTGHGEVMIRLVLAKKACDLMEEGVPAQRVAERIVRMTNGQVPRAILAILCIDMQGRVGAARNVKTTPHAFIREGMIRPRPNFAPVVMSV
jgi:beta-aspartyl-peptidase (threonine type)